MGMAYDLAAAAIFAMVMFQINLLGNLLVKRFHLTARAHFSGLIQERSVAILGITLLPKERPQRDLYNDFGLYGD